MGGREILLVGLPFTGASTERIQSYLEILKRALGTAPLVVAVPFSTATGVGSWELLPKLLIYADLLALDMQDTYVPDGTSDLLDATDYYLRQYDMRLLLSTANTNLLQLPRIQAIGDRQVITAPPEVIPEPLDPTTPNGEQTTPPDEEVTENGAYG